MEAEQLKLPLGIPEGYFDQTECKHGVPYRYPCRECNDEVVQEALSGD